MDRSLFEWILPIWKEIVAKKKSLNPEVKKPEPPKDPKVVQPPPAPVARPAVTKLHVKIH